MSVDQSRLPALHQRGLLPGRPGTEDLFIGKKNKEIRQAVSGGGMMGYRENTRVETSNVSGDQRANMGRGRDKKKGMSLFPLEACLWISLISSVRQREANVTVI